MYEKKNALINIGINIVIIIIEKSTTEVKVYYSKFDRDHFYLCL